MGKNLKYYSQTSMIERRRINFNETFLELVSAYTKGKKL